MLLTVLACLFMLLRAAFGKRSKAAKNNNAEAETQQKSQRAKCDRKTPWKLFSLVPAVVAVIAFVLTEDMRLPMILLDRWTLLMLVIVLAQVLVLILAKRKAEKPQDGDTAEDENTPEN